MIVGRVPSLLERRASSIAELRRRRARRSIERVAYAAIQLCLFALGVGVGLTLSTCQ